jgi:hypothetical protein
LMYIGIHLDHGVHPMVEVYGFVRLMYIGIHLDHGVNHGVTSTMGSPWGHGRVRRGRTPMGLFSTLPE